MTRPETYLQILRMPSRYTCPNRSLSSTSKTVLPVQTLLIPQMMMLCFSARAVNEDLSDACTRIHTTPYASYVVSSASYDPPDRGRQHLLVATPRSAAQSHTLLSRLKVSANVLVVRSLMSSSHVHMLDL